MFREGNRRSIIKMLSWRVWATIATIILVYLFIGKIEIAIAIGGVEVVLKMLLYYIHERFWNRINLGRKKVDPFVLWFTGLSSSGKSTLADETYEYIKKKGFQVERLDGDTVRSIFPDTGFTKEEREKHIRRVGFLASMLEKNGVIVVASFISPYQDTRDFVRGLCSDFVEVHVNASLEECERRDVKGLYKKARSGQIDNFTGISAPYEYPEKAELVINAGDESVEESFAQIQKYIAKYL